MRGGRRPAATMRLANASGEPVGSSCRRSTSRRYDRASRRARPTSREPLFPGGFAGLTFDGEPGQIRFYDHAMRTTRAVAELPPGVGESLSISPDGTELLYAAQNGSGADLWLLEFPRWRSAADQHATDTDPGDCGSAVASPATSSSTTRSCVVRDVRAAHQRGAVSLVQSRRATALDMLLSATAGALGVSSAERFAERTQRLPYASERRASSRCARDAS